MIFYNADLDVDDNDGIEEKLKELDNDHEREIQKRYDTGEIVNYKSNNGNGKTFTI